MVIKKKQISIGKIELVKRIKENLEKTPSYRRNPLTGEQVGNVFDRFLEEFEKVLTEGKSVSMKGYFTAKIVETKPRIGLNPQTQKKMTIPKKKRISFKVSDNLKGRLNNQKNKR